MAQARSPRTALLPLATLLLSTFIIDAGQGLLNSLVPLRLGQMGFAARDAGLVGAAYFTGFVGGVWYGALVVHRVGHIRAFGGFLALLASFALVLPLVPEVWAWAGVRFLHGGAIAAVAMVIESWLTAAAPRRWRGRILALYTMLTYGGFAAGQALLPLYDVAGFEAFSLAAILLALSSVPVVFSRRIRAPRMEEPHGVSLPALLRISPLSLVGSLASGLILGAFLALGPLFVARLGLGVEAVAVIMAAAMLGGVVFEWPIGHLSDIFDRRNTMILAGVIAAALAAAIALAGGTDLWLLAGLVALFGGLAFALYPLALAHAADRLGEGENMVPVATGLLVAYGLGAAVGPSLAGLAFDLAAGRGLFVYMTTVLALFAAFGAWRRLRRAAPEAARQGAYVAMPETEGTAAMLELDPRVRPAQLELSLENEDEEA